MSLLCSKPCDSMKAEFLIMILEILDDLAHLLTSSPANAPSLVLIQSYWPSDQACSYSGAIVLAMPVVWNIPASFSSFFLLSKAIPDQHIKILITTSIPTTNSILLFWFFFLALTVNTLYMLLMYLVYCLPAPVECKLQWAEILCILFTGVSPVPRKVPDT